MSVEVMAMVFNRYRAGGNERLLALALADQADKSGARIFPSVATLATMSAQSERSVQRLLHVMLASGWLQLVRKSSGRRGDCNEYRISPEWIAGGEPIAPQVVPDRRTAKRPPSPLTGANLSPVKADLKATTGDKLAPVQPAEGVDKFSTTGDTHGLSGDTTGLSGDTAVSPNPVLPVTTHNPLTPAGAGDVEKPAGQTARPPWRWRESFEGVCARGEGLGMPYSTKPLGTCYTDEELKAHRAAYERQVLAAHERAESERPQGRGRRRA